MISINDAWTHPDLPWLSDLVTRHQSIIDRRLSHGDLKRWSDALKSIPKINADSATLGRAVGLDRRLERPAAPPPPTVVAAVVGVVVVAAVLVSAYLLADVTQVRAQRNACARVAGRTVAVAAPFSLTTTFLQVLQVRQPQSAPILVPSLFFLLLAS